MSEIVTDLLTDILIGIGSCTTASIVTDSTPAQYTRRRASKHGMPKYEAPEIPHPRSLRCCKLTGFLHHTHKTPRHQVQERQEAKRWRRSYCWTYYNYTRLCDAMPSLNVCVLPIDYLTRVPLPRPRLNLVMAATEPTHDLPEQSAYLYLLT